MTPQATFPLVVGTKAQNPTEKTHVDACPSRSLEELCLGHHDDVVHRACGVTLQCSISANRALFHSGRLPSASAGTRLRVGRSDALDPVLALAKHHFVV